MLIAHCTVRIDGELFSQLRTECKKREIVIYFHPNTDNHDVHGDGAFVIDNSPNMPKSKAAVPAANSLLGKKRRRTKDRNTEQEGYGFQRGQAGLKKPKLTKNLETTEKSELKRIGEALVEMKNETMKYRPNCFSSEERSKKFSKQLSEAIGLSKAVDIAWEHFTIARISTFDPEAMLKVHVDAQNCYEDGYYSTATISYIFVDEADGFVKRFTIIGYSRCKTVRAK